MNNILEHREQVRQNIMKSFSADNDIEKARTGIYVDNSENRKLSRVGKKYGGSEISFKRGHKVNATLPSGKVIQATYVEPYGKDKHTVKFEGKLYGVSTVINWKKISGQYVGKKRGFAALSKMEDKLNDVISEIKDLKRKRKDVEIDMEETISQAAKLNAEKNGTSYDEELDSIVNDGNNPIVKKFGKELDKIDNKIGTLQNKYDRQKKTLSKHGW